MSIERRKYERFPLKITARRVTDERKWIDFEIAELSVGGCFAGIFAEAHPGYTFRIKLELANGDWLPLVCRVRYRYMTVGIGIQFVDITHTEQRLVAELIIDRVKKAGLPAPNPFAPPKVFEESRRMQGKK